jgi:hypothetical protein
LCTEEAERLKSVEERLSGVLGLTSITASLLIGGIFAIVDGGLSDSSRILDATDVTCQAQKSRRLFVAGSICWIIGGLYFQAPLHADSPSPEQHSAHGECHRE